MIAVRVSRRWSRTCLIVLLAALSLSVCCHHQTRAADEASEEEAQQIKAAERFLTVLQKTPRRGTALDRVYGHHVEFGTLEKFLSELKDKTTADPKDGVAWMLLGLFEAQRGQDGNAVDALQQAESARPTDAMASYYLAQSLLRVGQNEEAVAAFERAIERKPQRNDLLEIFQQLGRVHQRAQRTEEAMKVWQRLESLFPDDPRVLEQIAITLAEEGDSVQALSRYERLSKLVKDDYRRTMCLIEVAELKIKSGQKDSGISDLENVLAQLDPDSWIYKDVRRRIDDVFLRSGDQDSLVKYYEKWLNTHPEDVEGMARLARFLAQSARVPEATQWMEKALKLAPSRTDLRKSFIDQLVDDQRIPEAIQQYKQLAAAAPGNPDFLRDWGKLILKDKAQDLDVRKKEAVRIWNQIVANRPDDAITVAQVADLFRQANLNDEATALYQKAVELAPGDPQYREYLGEFYHIQKRTDDALKTWSSIADGPQRTAENVARLAEVYNSFGYLDQALKEIGDACILAPKEFILQMRAAEYHMRASKYEEALAFVVAAEKLAASDDDRDSLIRQRIEILQSSQQLDEEIKKLLASIEANASATPADWALLARYYEANRQWPEATESIEKGLTIDPKSIPTLTAAARISESSGDFGRAADFNRRLAETDRRSKGDHLMNVARLEAQLGRSDQALAAANELIVSAPGNTDNYEFLAQMCFRLGKSDEGLEALRKAVRINPNEPHLIMALASALADQLRTDEAIEVYWRAFDKSETVDDKTSLTQKLVPLYEQINQVDKLIERFERDRREEEKRREMTICLAQAYQTSGDAGTARLELEQLLGEDSRDTNLLQQLSKLCESNGDMDAAIGYQRQLIAVAPGHETEFPLVNMLQQRGDRDEAMEILVRLTAREQDPVRLMKSIDSLLNQGAYEAAIRITEPLVSQQRDDWELLYREGVAWANLTKLDEAKNRFDRILNLTLPHDTLGLYANDEYKRALAKAKSENLKGNRTQGPQKPSPLAMSRNTYAVQTAVGLRSDNNDYYSNSRSTPQVWSPREYGTARMACFGWLLKFEADAETAAENSEEKSPRDAATDGDADGATDDSKPVSSVVARVASKVAGPEVPREAIYDRLYVAGLQADSAAQFEMARRLAVTGGTEDKRYFMTSLQGRSRPQSNSSRSSGSEPPKPTPLSEDDLTLMLQCYEELSKPKAEEDAPIAGGQVVYDDEGNAYVNVGGQWVMMGSGRGGGRAFLMPVVNELKLAGREAEANSMFDAAVAEIKTASDASAAYSLYMQMEKTDELPAAMDRWFTLAKEELSKPEDGNTASRRTPGTARVVLAQMSNSLMQSMGKLGADEENVQILALLDQSLDLATMEARERIAAANAARKPNSRSSASRSAQYANQVSMSWYYGKESSYIQIPYPYASVNLDRTPLMLLRQVYEVLNRNDVASDLVVRLKERVARAAPEDAVFENMYLAAALWWVDEQDDAVDIIAEVAATQKDDPSAQFELAQLRIQRGDLDDALTIIDSIVARDQKLLQQRELLALDLAARVADYDRARSAAERLFGLRLDSQTQLSLIGSMKRLGLNEMADAVIARTERQSGNQPEALASLMMLYQGQGKTDQAKQLAHMLLRKTVSPITTMASSARNPLRSSSSSNSSRTQALQVLQQTGELKSLISQLESQVERSPDSSKLTEQLIEFYGVSGERNKVAPLLLASLEKRPDSHALRLQLAKQYQQTNKNAEACDQYIELMKVKPDWIFDDFYQIRNLFKSANKSADVVNALKTMNLKQIRQPYYIVDFVGDLLNDEANEKVALELLDKIVDAFPSYKTSAISRIRNPKLWQSDSFFELGRKMVLPTDADIKSNSWSGLSVYSYSSDGTVSSHFHFLLRGLETSPRLEDLRTSILTSCEKNPTWHAGRAMIAMIELQQGKKDEARERLQTLLSDEELAKSIPSDSAWLIGQELDKFQETRTLAQSLFEKAMTRENGMQEFRYTPGPRLIKTYMANGRRDDARELLLKSVRDLKIQTSQADYAAYQRAENRINAADQFLEMKFTVDAVKLYQEMLGNESELRLAGEWNGDGNRYIAQAKKGLTSAMSSLDSTQAVEAVSQLLTVENAATGGRSAEQKPALDMMIRVPTTLQTANAQPGDAPSGNIAPESVTSGLVQLLVTISSDDNVRKAIEQRLDKIAEEYPDDFSIAISRTTYLGQMKSPKFAESITALSRLVQSHPLEEIPEGRRPNSRQRRQAATLVPLWMVAKQGLSDKTNQDAASIIAERAFQAARRQTGVQASALILFEWSELLLANGDKPQAEARLKELLKLATERPSRKAKPQSPAGDAQPPASDGRARPVRGATGKIDRRDRDAGILPVFPRSNDYVLTTAQQDSAFSPVATEKAESGQNGAAGNLVPPLTISQFRVAMRIAKIAAEQEMSDLSLTAVREAMVGGSPVPDTAESPVQNGRVTRVVNGVPLADGESQFDQEVVTSLQTIFSLWRGDLYPAEEVYELVKRLMFPESRPAETMLYADHSQLRNAVPRSLMPTMLDWAGRAGKLDDLRAKVESRNDGTNVVNSLVLLTSLDLAESRTVAAAETLTRLGEELQKNPSPALLQLACHAAIPASSKPELETQAFSILRLATQTPWGSPDSYSEVTTGQLDQMVNRYLVKTGDLDSVRKYFDAQQAAKQTMYARYGGDYGLYRQWYDLAGFASEAARNGIPSIAFDYLGRTADFDAKQYSMPDVVLPLMITVRHFSTLEPRERFNVWRDWTLPTADRRTVRFLFSTAQRGTPPEVFLKLNPQPGIVAQDEIVSNLTELITAARECNAIEELQELVKQASEEKLPNSELLALLLLIESGDKASVEPAFKSFFESMTERRKDRGNRSACGEFLVLQQCLRNDDLAAIPLSMGKPRFRKLFEDLNGSDFNARIELEFAQRQAILAKSELDISSGTQLMNWTAVSPSTSGANMAPQSWIGHDNLITHFAGRGSDYLYLNWPIEGDFEFSVDCLEKYWGECDAGYGGVIVFSQVWGSTGTICNFNGDDAIQRPGGKKRGVPSYNTVTIQSRSGMMRYLLNGSLVYEEKLTGTCPWIVLASERSRVSVFRNPRISGTPVIPQEIKLIGETSMEGWTTSGFQDRRSSPRLMAEKVTDPNSSIAYEQRGTPAVFDWSVKDSLLTAVPVPEAAADLQSRLIYSRPLLAEETFRYEFFYEPGRIVAQPAIGRLAFLLADDGVKTHWMSAVNWDDVYHGISLDNAVTESEFQKGEGKLDLKASDWNTVVMHRSGHVLEILVNDKIALTYPISDDLDLRPGFFRYKQQECRIRNVTLSGPWPEQFSEDLDGKLLDLKSPLMAEDRQLLESILPDHVRDLQLPEIVQAARKMASPDEAYAYLHRWVLSGDDHNSIRLGYFNVPVEPGQNVVERSMDDLQSPAIDLVEAASKLNRIDELLKEVDAIPANIDIDKRNKEALAALLTMRGTNPEATSAAVKSVRDTLFAGLPQSLSPQERSAEVLVAWSAMKQSETLPMAVELTTKLRDNERDEKLRSNDDRFQRMVHGMIGRLDLAERSLAKQKTEQSKQWASVPYLKPAHLYQGFRPSHWTYAPGVVKHHPAETWSQLIYQSPLQGKFEILVNRSTFGYKEVAVSWGMHSAEPRYDLKAVKVVKLMHNSKDIEQTVTLPAWEMMAEFRIVVDGSKVTTFTNGVQIHEENLDGKPSPWLILQSHNATDEAAIENLRIVGTPEIPDQIDLINMAGWACWRADIYGEWHNSNPTDDSAPWRKVGDEIVGRKNENAAAPTESLLHYQRPMLEDGEIEFETFYVPGEQEVYPAVGQSAFLLQPDGVKLHTLTAAQFESRDLTVDNSSPIHGAAATVELKANDWNLVKLKLKGDQLTVVVNGVDVATHTVTEKPGERFFGLFRYSNQTQCRVRNLVYRGEWPKTLPAIEEQELAAANAK